MTKKQHYMNWEERCQLEALLGEKVPVAKIAERLGFCRQTIYDEIKRGTYIHTCAYWDEERYSAEKGQQVHDRNQTAKGKPLKIGNDRKFADFLEKKMLGVQEDGTVDKRKRCSPAAALALAKREKFHTTICVSTLYSYIEKRVFLHLTNKDLWEKGKKKKRGYRPIRRIAHPKLPSISTRPKEIDQREEKGHWEIDLVVGKDGSRPVLLTMVERSTRKPLLFKLPDKRAETVRKIFDTLERKMGKQQFRETFKTITTDNGSEFLEYDRLVKSIHGGERFHVYYCHSYSAWEKGSNENMNRMIRRWFPKGTDFSKVSKKEIAALQDWMNHYPRKVLNWKCPAEMMSVTQNPDQAPGSSPDIV